MSETAVPKSTVAPTTHAKLLEWVEETVELTQPSQV
ncbi:MAG: hypothetical protein QOD76_35, partial [Solirubrobacteraceae bacterium]|nr:hypothetical protein [Solirubrobacteraceae bacterium]